MTSAAIAVLVLIIDLATKSAAAAGLVRAPWIQPAVNPDLALGVVGGPAGVEILGAVLALVAALVVLRRGPAGPLPQVAIGLVAGASLGNLTDRLAFGSVRDFLVGPHVLFNVADVALFVGLAAFGVSVADARRRRADSGR